MITSVALAPVARQQFLDANGNPLVGAKLFTYQSGTNTKLETYQDSTGTSTNTNPILLDSSGRPPKGVWLSNTAYRFVFAPSTDTDPPTSPIYTEDGILTKAVVPTDTSEAQWQFSGLLPTYISTSSFSVAGDTTLMLEVGRRIRATLGASYVYGTITTSTYAAGITTVVVRLDSGVLSVALSELYYSTLTYSNQAIPNVYAPVIFGKNLLINPAFTVNQRAVSGTVTLAAGVYGHDRWKAGASGCTYTFATVNGLTTLTITAGSLIQVVEDVNVPYGTNTLVLSWTGTAQGKVGAGSYSSSGVTASVSGGANLNVEFNTGTLSLVQLEKSAFPTAFEQRPYTVEFDLCRRYFEYLVCGTVNAYLGIGMVTASTLANIQINYYPKRRVPLNADFSVVSLNGISNGIAAAVLYGTSLGNIASATLITNSVAYSVTGAVAFISGSVAGASGVKINVEL